MLPYLKIYGLIAYAPVNYGMLGRRRVWRHSYIILTRLPQFILGLFFTQCGKRMDRAQTRKLITHLWNSTKTRTKQIIEIPHECGDYSFLSTKQTYLILRQKI